MNVIDISDYKQTHDTNWLNWGWSTCGPLCIDLWTQRTRIYFTFDVLVHSVCEQSNLFRELIKLKYRNLDNIQKGIFICGS